MNRLTKVIGAVVGLTAFAVAVLTGLAVGARAEHTLGVALLSLIACNILGLVVGGIAEHIVESHLARYRAAHAAPVAPTEDPVFVEVAPEENDGAAHAGAASVTGQIRGDSR